MILSIFSHVIYHLCVFFGEVSVQLFCQFLNCVVFLLLSFKNSFYILDTSSLSSLCFTNICKMLSFFVGKYVCFILASEGNFFLLSMQF